MLITLIPSVCSKKINFYSFSEIMILMLIKAIILPLLNRKVIYNKIHINNI